MQKIKKEKIPCRISFYTELRTENVSFTDLIKLTRKRISILKSLETVRDSRIMDLEFEDDILSHFLCRLVCCNIPWVYNWFISAELRLLKYRLRQFPLSEFKNFFYSILLKKARNLRIEGRMIYIDIDTEFVFDDDDLNAVSDIFNVKVHFSKAPEVLKDKTTQFENGYFVLNDIHLQKIIVSCYREYLTGRMDELKKNYSLKHDERFQNLSVELFTDSQKTITHLNSILEKSPPCIHSVIQRMTNNKHLKFNDRQVLVRYLKDCGLPVNDCIEFIRSNFCCDPAYFEKEYVYSIRHNYGLEGKKANYNTYGCTQIVKMCMCPFANGEIGEYLKTKNFNDIEDVIKEDVKNKNFLNGCKSLLKKMCENAKDEPISSPVVFFKNWEN